MKQATVARGSSALHRALSKMCAIHILTCVVQPQFRHGSLPMAVKCWCCTKELRTGKLGAGGTTANRSGGAH